LIKAAGYNFSFPAASLGTAFTKLTSVLPIYGIGGFGTTEGFWSLGFVALGVEKTTAIVTGFVYHIFSILYTLIVGITSLLSSWKKLFS